MALPVYTMNCFKLPKGTCEEINRTLADYWWSKGSGNRSMHWLRWERMGLPEKRVDWNLEILKVLTFPCWRSRCAVYYNHRKVLLPVFSKVDIL